MPDLQPIVGSFRQRQRLADKTTGLVKQHGRTRVAAKTHAAIDEFEERLRRSQEEALAGISDDDVPPSADALARGRPGRGSGHLLQSAGQTTLGRSTTGRPGGVPDTRRSSHSSTSSLDRSPGRSSKELARALSESAVALDVDTRRAMRPPSPLGMYNYGSISSRPRSLLAQRGKPSGDTSRPKYRQTSCGFYFPGAGLRQGPYGFSMIEPIHMTQHSWAESASLPTRWAGDAGDARPAQPGKHQARSHKDAPTLSQTVRPSRAHDLRARRVFDVLDRRREEAFLEKICFERGVFEGKWRDPLLDGGAAVLEQDPEEKHEYLQSERDDEAAAKRNASRILFGLERAMREGRGNLQNLFRAVNKNTPNVLEADELLAGIVRLGIVQPGELAISDVVEAMLIIDPAFDGRVNFPVLSHALAATQRVHKQKVSAQEMAARQDQHIEHNTYHSSLPVDVVKVDWRSRSLFDFERDFEKFRHQQRTLLSQHNEASRE